MRSRKDEIGEVGGGSEEGKLGNGEGVGRGLLQGKK